MKRYIAIATASLLALATMIGIPIKAYVKQMHTQLRCIDITYHPNIWTPTKAKTYAYGYIKVYYPDWNRSEWRALVKLWTIESHWNHKADNPQSTAYGIAQVLGTTKDTTAPQQVALGLSYIVHRYDKPSVAWAFHRKHGYY